MFLGGYFSKEQILIKTSSALNRGLLVLLLLGIARITLSYCIKLTFNIVYNKKESPRIKLEVLMLIPLLVLRRLSIIGGYFLVFGLLPSIRLDGVSSAGILWLLILFSVSLIVAIKAPFYLFYLQGKLISVFNVRKYSKILSNAWEGNYLEPLFA